MAKHCLFSKDFYNAFAVSLHSDGHLVHIDYNNIAPLPNGYVQRKNSVREGQEELSIGVIKDMLEEKRQKKKQIKRNINQL